MNTEIFHHSNLVLLSNKQAKTNISGIGTDIVGRNFTLVIMSGEQWPAHQILL